MHNDIRNDAFPRVRRTVLSSLVSVAAVIGMVWLLVVSVIDAANVFANGGQGRVRASIPIPDQWVSVTLSAAETDLENAGTGFADVMVSGVPVDVVDGFVLTQVVSLALVVALALIVGFAAVSTLVGRLRWGLLSWLTIAGGALLTAGSLLTQSLSSTAAENLSVWMLPADEPWLEPGLLAGIDFTTPLAGVALIVLGAAFRSSARYAREANGVV